jgi:hypothetical protein
MSVLVSRISLVIASGASVSSAGILGGRIPTVLQMPDTWTAATISFAGTGDSLNYYFIFKEDGLLLNIPADVNNRIVLPSQYFSDHQGIMVCSGTRAAPVNQTADRILYLEAWE